MPVVLGFESGLMYYSTLFFSEAFSVAKRSERKVEKFEENRSAVATLNSVIMCMRYGLRAMQAMAASTTGVGRGPLVTTAD